jgi:coenzyme F420-reducing hydrogenase alpha subunit
MPQKTIKVDYLTRVEGEGALTVRFSGEEVRDVEFRIFEPPRFFEAFLRGRDRAEVPDITARICGICPVAYQMSSVHAIERAAGVTVGGQLRELRRLLYCGEWLESHVLHAFMLHLPDFLGYQDSIAMAKDHGDKVAMALRMKKAGNAIVHTLGGREIHPINVRLGGFYRVPTRRELQALRPELAWGRDAARTALRWLTQTLTYPDFERDYVFVALRHASEYPFNEGRLVSNHGLDIDVGDYETHFEERHVERSNALHSVLKVGGRETDYFCGPLARFNLNFDHLSASAREAAFEAGLTPPVMNPFKSLPVRLVETVFAFDEALRIVDQYEPPPAPYVELPLRAGMGWACTEAPRGILYHRYRVDEAGHILDAKIVPPTSQNQKCIESDLRALAPQFLTVEHDAATWLAEQAVRNYDPCISCATHFLKLKMEQV